MAGVIDERTDLALLAALADARPQWQWMLVGPVVKIDAAALPRRPNLHWLGLQPHRVLPGLLAGWQAVVLPWADHLATRHAAPIQLLEALAAGLPVVATRLPGTVGQCALARAGDRVRLVLPGPLAQALPDWLAACEAALADGRLARPTWRLPGSMDWDAVAQRADALLCGLLRARGG
jgi:glycosyltransferase involved in cell wall biosynthesis